MRVAENGMPSSRLEGWRRISVIRKKGKIERASSGQEKAEISCRKLRAMFAPTTNVVSTVNNRNNTYNHVRCFGGCATKTSTGG